MVHSPKNSKSALQRRRKKCNMSDPCEHGQFTVKNTFLEININAEQDERLLGAWPLSPAISSPGKMQSTYRNHASLMDAFVKDDPEWKAPSNCDESDDTTPNYSNAASSSEYTDSAFTSWNTSVAPFEPVKNQFCGNNTGFHNKSGRYNMSRNNPVRIFHRGQNVVLLGLTANGAPYNGFWGKVDGYNNKYGRYNVILTDFVPAVTATVKSSNIMSIPNRNIA
eukprot:GEMP01052500.1.p1 GENE.GEMP01052500.1~~GEMP01052500.1.p1  ORF type:complete len:223 (+),score=31.49 GEMP01052500.1:76-744(+)